MPKLDVSELNIIASVLGMMKPKLRQRNPLQLTNLCSGVFTMLFGLVAVNVKSRWYLGEARE